MHLQAHPYLACSYSQQQFNTTADSSTTNTQGSSASAAANELSIAAASLEGQGRRLAGVVLPSILGIKSGTNGSRYAGAIVLAGRGDCTFTAKAAVALQGQAAGLLIINNVPSSLLAA